MIDTAHFDILYFFMVMRRKGILFNKQELKEQLNNTKNSMHYTLYQQEKCFIPNH